MRIEIASIEADLNRGAGAGTRDFGAPTPLGERLVDGNHDVVVLNAIGVEEAAVTKAAPANTAKTTPVNGVRRLSRFGNFFTPSRSTP